MDQILIVDDEKIVREMLSVRLRDQGYETISAKDGRQGLEMIKQYNPPLTILDLKMPKMTGKALLFWECLVH